MPRPYLSTSAASLCITVDTSVLLKKEEHAAYLDGGMPSSARALAAATRFGSSSASRSPAPSRVVVASSGAVQ